jgi:hypothetical protein
VSTAPAPQGNAMYVASQSDKDWLLDVQRKLYARSYENPQYVFCKLWGLVTDPRNLRVAMARVASNRGRRTAGVDGVTVSMVLRSIRTAWEVSSPGMPTATARVVSRPTSCASTPMESPVHSERCTPGSGAGAVETTVDNHGNGATAPCHRSLLRLTA